MEGVKDIAKAGYIGIEFFVSGLLSELKCVEGMLIILVYFTLINCNPYLCLPPPTPITKEYLEG
jgi:hypothetical protein